MSQINHIKDLSNCGYRISEISKETGADPKTIRKYLSQEDFSPAPPVMAEKPSILNPFKPIIQKWLEDDKKHWRKQHHTAQRAYDRLVEEHGYTGSYSIVQRYLKKCRMQQAEKANLELVWDPGPAQVDFCEADFYEVGKTCRKKYLTVSFPYSNDGYSQVFGGETAECVCQGLQDIFEFIGGVPPLLIFDNATGVGRRVGDSIHESELFSRFRAHYHFRVRFCNPYSGWEKGNVERKVGYNRANLFVPVPHFTQIEKYNQKLLLQHEKKAEGLHYKKQIPIRKLFEEDRKALLVLPPKRFNVCRYEWMNADGYGKICLDGKHFYSTAPENAKRKVLVGIRAHTVDILTDGGQILTSHRRMFGEGRTDISDYSTTLALLMKNSGAWHESGLCRETPNILRAYMDAQPKEKLKDCLRILNDLTNQYGFPAAASAMEMAAARGNVNICDAAVLAARITGYGIDTPPQSGPSLAIIYDETFLKKGRRQRIMMTPKMKEALCTRILTGSRQLFLSARISEICMEKGTQKQLEFVDELLQAELGLRDENRRNRLIKRAGFPVYKTFEGYGYKAVKFPPAFSREGLESLDFVPDRKNLVLYGPVGIGKTHMTVARG